jgi:hypothetical protein
LVRRPGNDL